MYNITIPTGYVEQVQMYPLGFEEFLITNGLNLEVIKVVKKCFKKMPIDEIVHKKLIDMFHLYLIEGGMLAVVSKYTATNNLKDVVEEQLSINGFYRQDMAKYDSENKLYKRNF